MRTLRLFVILSSVAALSGCGLEGVFGNGARDAYDRPASVIRGALASPGAQGVALSVLDGDGNALSGAAGPFAQSVSASGYEVRLPSSRYSMVRVQAKVGDLALRAIVPFVGEESSARGVDLDARSTAEALIVEAKLQIDGNSFRKLSPEAYLGTRNLIRAAFDQAGPTRDLLQMVERLVARSDPLSGAEPAFFRVPEIATEGDPATITVTTSPIDRDWLVRNSVDYDGVPGRDDFTTAFDAKLVEAAQLYAPEGCPDPSRVRALFTVDFREGTVNGSGSTVDRFKWATDVPGKRMFFVGWVHEDSPIQDPAVNNLLGASVPNVLPMYDDATNGDETAGDGVYTIVFDLPRGTPGSRLRVGYKYTWGTLGAGWTGTEEWPGNSRIIEIEDLNGDEFVYRRDVFGDESTNKDRSNLRVGTIDWSTDVRGCGIPEAREQRFVEMNAAVCGSEWHTPESVGPITVACTE